MKKKLFRLFGVAPIHRSVFLVLMLILGMEWQFVTADNHNYYGMPNDYLQYGAGARSLAMGGAYVALANEASAPYWNPAGLSQINEHQFLAMYAPFFEKTSYNFLSYVHPLGKIGNIAVSDVFLYSEGYEEVDGGGNVVGTNQSIFNNAVIISYASRIYGQISLGASLKLIHERVMKYSGNGRGIDLGMLYKPIDGLSIGLAVQNVLQPKVTLRYDRNVYKINLKGGLALKALSNRLIFTADVNRLVDEKAYFSVGMEISPWQKVASSLKRVDLRVGCNQLQTLTCGLGLRIKSLSVDYAFNTHDMGNLHKFALTFGWGNIYKTSASQISKSRNTLSHLTPCSPLLRSGK